MALNSNQYNPIWLRSQCSGVKWGARVLRVRSVPREEAWANKAVHITNHRGGLAASHSPQSKPAIYFPPHLP